jgi:hypothetical protein
VRQFFHERSLRRRAVALVAAYAIALASLLASFTAARAAVDVNNTLGVICHTIDSGQTAPAGGQDNGKACAENCCIGCLMLTAALPPPPLKASGEPQATGERLPLPAVTGLVTTSTTKSHRSRAPPLPA